MDIAAMSVQLASAKVSQSVNLAVAKKVMNIEETNGQALAQMLAPNNHILDVKA